MADYNSDIRWPSRSFLQGATVEFNALDLVITKNNKTLLKGNYTLNVKEKPATIDITYTDGPDRDKIASEIYQFDPMDQTNFKIATICLSAPADERPNDFSSLPKSRRRLIELRRREK